MTMTRTVIEKQHLLWNYVGRVEKHTEPQNSLPRSRSLRSLGWQRRAAAPRRILASLVRRVIKLF